MVPPKVVILIAMVMLTACQTPGGTFCDVERPNRDPVSDMTPAEARTALAHNLKGAKLCRWKP
ncbi:hypothetical protein [Mesorhizobium sp. BR1-1-4]|uniref:hypothetical protein n=1 Tax=Mesorhizobium sp. BR1-1-4 TaxID=2876650 RepID=UPI001CCFD172|nr:hypothetical protein [Mesorhizobium sp. BR1-1-4]MBZ9926796.1 hypothetical protein [Mesorhizobium sp. BR1-1-4]